VRLNFNEHEKDEAAPSQTALAQAREAIAKDALRKKRNEEDIAALARVAGLEVVQARTGEDALQNAVAIQVSVFEELSQKINSAVTPLEAQQWQEAQRTALKDLRVAEESLYAYRMREAQSVHKRTMERFRTVGGVSLGVVAIVAGTSISLLGHPIVGAPIVGGGIAFIRQALGNIKEDKRDGENGQRDTESQSDNEQTSPGGKNG
jgi:hypothetical protein